MKKHPIVGQAGLLRRSALLGLAIGALGASPALASTTSPATQTLTPPSSINGIACSTETFSQSLLSYGDSAWYTMVPGESPDNLTGQGWTLSGGASIVSTKLADGTTGDVLDLPSGAVAYSAPECINNGFNEARAEIKGASGVQFYIQPATATGWGTAQNTGQFHSTGWALSGELNLNNSVTGWEAARFEFKAAGNATGDFQLYNFWLDPKMMH